MRMAPPHAKPTLHALLSSTPNSRAFGAPLAITSAASVMTSASTQPPDTEPRKLPASSMTSWLPTGCGAEPQVSMTVASATCRPSACQSSAFDRTNRSVALIAEFGRLVLPTRKVISGGRLRWRSPVIVLHTIFVVEIFGSDRSEALRAARARRDDAITVLTRALQSKGISGRRLSTRRTGHDPMLAFGRD